MNRMFGGLPLTAAVLAFVGAEHAADMKKGEELVNKGGCIACHGASLDKSVAPSYPVVSGQCESYLFHALQQYQSKHKTPLYGRSNPIMGGMVAQYDAQQLHDIAAYVASLTGPLDIRGEMH
ncbi:c-type cytochrome [Thiomonas sp. FB-Cd]|uniref:c-type cytochrome n=1 Tax=Thiomonas sp. FB-Cd TaxID=1158292 RepID=UPI0004DF07F1|nr:c-type cytochrome [Thiomonas sp. FB-Cd]